MALNPKAFPNKAVQVSDNFSRAFLALPLRLKITLPYMVVAILLAGLATWVISQSFVASLQERFNVQLVDSFEAASVQIFEAESKALIGVRAIVRTLGVAQAVTTHDVDRLNVIIRPLAANEHLPLVYVLDHTGALVYRLHVGPTANIEGDENNFVNWAPVRQVLSGQSDTLGDKFSGVQNGPDGAAIYVAGPLLLNNQIVGVVLVGFPVGPILPQMVTDSNAQVSIYQPDGQVMFSTFADQFNIPGLTSEQISLINSQKRYLLENRLWSLGSDQYTEALGPLLVRGQPSGWALAVALPRALITSSARVSPQQLTVAFALAVLAVIALGIFIARIIAVPIFELVHASTRVAQGDLEASVVEHAPDELGLLSRQFNHMVSELRQRERMHDLFGRMVSEEVREALLQDHHAHLGGDLKIVSVLFTDIRQFTAFSETHTPEEVVEMLNSYFGIVSQAIREAGGMLNKFGGDSTLAIFGAPVNISVDESARRALSAALLIRIRITEANTQRIQAGLEPFQIGIGINTGEVITGNIGAEDRFEYTVIGDTVNVAERMQSLANHASPSNIFISEATYTAFAHRSQLLVIDCGEVSFKGRIEPVHVYNVIGMSLTLPPPALSPDKITRPQHLLRRDAFEAIYLYCRGFHPTTIATTKNLPLETVNVWIKEAAAHFDRAKRELLLEFQLTERELQRLDDINQVGLSLEQNLAWDIQPS